MLNKYEVVLAKDLKSGDQIVFDEVVREVVEFVPWPKPACSGTMGFGAHGHLKVWRSERERSFKAWKPLTNWFESLGYKLGYLRDKFDHTDCRPDDLYVRWIQIAEETPAVRLKKGGEAV